jgi:hypothetical protein
MTNPNPTPTPSNAPLPTNVALLWSLAIVRAIGYVLLFFSILEFIDTVFPPRLTNPGWEFQTFGGLVDRVPIVLLAFGLIYLGREIGRNPKERFILPALPWLALIIGIMYLLLIPLGILNTNRLLRLNNQQIVQLEQGKAQVKKVQTNLKNTNTQTDLQKFLTQDLGYRNQLPPIQNPQQIKEIKDQIATAIQGGENQLNNQSERLQAARTDLLKKSIKWNIGAFLSGVLFIYIWRLMRRRSQFQG